MANQRYNICIQIAAPNRKPHSTTWDRGVLAADCKKFYQVTQEELPTKENPVRVKTSGGPEGHYVHTTTVHFVP